MPFIDTHTHLTFPEFDSDREEVLKRAWEADIEALIVVGAGDGVEGNRKALNFALGNDKVFAALGIHPHDADKVDVRKAVSELEMLAKRGKEKVVAIGEIGLDYYRMNSTPKAQVDCFNAFLDLSFELKLPISIHDREAHEDVLFVLRRNRHKLSGGVFHCFSGDVSVAHEALEFGFYIAIPGIVTFGRADTLKGVVKNVPIEKLVLETDCPYLSPEPYRGKRNEPAYVVRVAEEISKIKNLSLEDVARITTINAKRVFNLPGMMPLGKIVYPIRKSLYINLTNRCTLDCTFCPKQSGSFEVKGHNLKLMQEPNVEDVFRAVGELKGYEEVVFCGFGEPTLRFELLKVIARRLRSGGIRVRLDTDGLLNLVHKRDVLPELKGIIDAVSVSMNAPDPKTYVKLCPSKYGEDAFFAMLSFIERAKEYIPEVTATVVGLPGLDVDSYKRLAIRMGVRFKVREHQDLG